MTAALRPFWYYYGSKARAAKRYPEPVHRTIVEPFAGAAGYSLRYADRDVVIVDKYEVIAGIWTYLIGVKPEEVRSIPWVEHVDDLPAWVPQEARWLVGFWLNAASAAPCKRLSSGRIKKAATGGRFEGWTQHVRDRIASQVPRIRHWRVIHGDYTQAPDVEATWYVDPPYNNRAGSYYVHADVNYVSLAQWCLTRRGQTIVCENEGADWLPFEPFATLQTNMHGKASREVVWLSSNTQPVNDDGAG